MPPSSRKIVALCEKCGHPLRAYWATEDGIPVKHLNQHFTCPKCGHANSLKAHLETNVTAAALVLTIAETEEAVRRNPRDQEKTRLLASLRHQVGVGQASAGQLEEAVKLLDEAVNLDPSNEAIRRDWDAIHDTHDRKEIAKALDAKQFSRASEHLWPYCRRHPEDGEARRLLGEVCSRCSVESANLAIQLRKRRGDDDITIEEVNAIQAAISAAGTAVFLCPGDPSISSQRDSIARLARNMRFPDGFIEGIERGAQKKAEEMLTPQKKKPGPLDWLFGKRG